MLPLLSPPRPPSTSTSTPSRSPSRSPISRYAFPSGEFSPVVLHSIFEGTPRGQPFKHHDVVRDVRQVGYYGLALSLAGIVLWNSQSPVKGYVNAIRTQGKVIAVVLTALPAVAIGEGVSANIRQRESFWNTATGAALGGLVVGQLGRTRQQTIGISLTLGLVAGIMHYLPWGGRYGPLPYDPDMIVQRDNDRIIAGMALREWEDIKPPPGKGYGIFPGWDRSYTLDARIAGKPSTPEQWAEPQGRDVIWPAGGNRVLRPVAPKPELIDYSNM